jgi:phosphoglucosamine mutase
MALGASAARVVRARGERGPIVVGRDPRISGDLLGAALMAGVCSQGVDVVDIGIVPTPGVAHATRHLGAAAGVVISASHNPVQDNGIKFFGPDGHKLPDDEEAEFESTLAGWEQHPRPSGALVGRITRTTAPIEEYAAFLCGSIAPMRLDGLRLAVDCANGAASVIGPSVLRSLGATVVPLAAEPDGVNINADCGSLHPQAMAARVVAEHAHAGLAFDGDADRVILSDERGRIFDGDRILCTLALHLSAGGRLKNDVIVGTVMSNLGLEQALTRAGVRFVRAPVGDRYVSEQMEEHGAIVGGEKSGHILLPEVATTGDGILTALMILRIVADSGRPLSAWADEMTELPQRLVNVRVRDKEGWRDIPAVADALAAAERRLDGTGRILVRPSGTERMIRVMAEGPDATEVDALVTSVADALRAHLGET